MYRPLVACPGCSRHVRATEMRCPFCAAALPGDLGERAAPSVPSRLSRAAAFAFGASLAIAGCATDVTTGDAAGSTSGGEGGAGPGPGDEGGGQAVYGAPAPEDAGVEEDAGLLDAGPDDDGGDVDLYGAPPPPDAGPSDDGGFQGMYGGAPPP